MNKKYKTKNNLNKAWEHIDECMSHWYLAMDIIGGMSFDEDSSDLFNITNTIHRVDISSIGAVKQHLEELIENKEKMSDTNK